MHGIQLAYFVDVITFDDFVEVGIERVQHPYHLKKTELQSFEPIAQMLKYGHHGNYLSSLWLKRVEVIIGGKTSTVKATP